MIELNLLSSLTFFVLIAVSTLAGLGLSFRMPWSDWAKLWKLNVALGIGIAPFLAGISSVIALLFFPGASHLLHILFVYCALGAGALLAFKPLRKVSLVKVQIILDSYLLRLIFLIWVSLLLFNSIFIPLLQNDALEYAIVGRELFQSRSLEIYPLLDPNLGSSGFFAPWTHPPLYVSLIYLTSTLQGHADVPGLMRLIAPWFLLSALYSIVMLGRLLSTNVGWLAGILMAAPLSVPVLNLLIPVFGVATFTHLFHTLNARRAA